MARKLNRLSARKVAGALAPGRYADGGGLYLQVARGGSKSWLFCYQRAGRRHDMGLGGVTSVPLAKAREKAAAARALLADGRDPLQERRGLLVKQRGTVTFREAAESYVIAHAPGWRGNDNVAQWRGTLSRFAFPIIGDVAVGDVDQTHILQILLQRLGRDETVHGFRSTFRDWAGEQTNFAREVAEMALAHVVGDQTERAYARGDLFAKRAQLMRAWARFCATPARAKGEVVALVK